MKWLSLQYYNYHLKPMQFVKIFNDYKAEYFTQNLAVTNPLFAIKYGNLGEINKVTDFVKAGSIGIVDSEFNFSNGKYTIRFFDFVEERMLREDLNYVLQQIKYRSGQVVLIKENDLYKIGALWN